MKMLPGNLMKSMRGSEIEDELDNCFSGMITCCMVDGAQTDWILDSGATDHMTSSMENLANVRIASSNCTIHLPTGKCCRNK